MAPLKGGHSSDELSISPGPTGATPAERSGQIHRCRMTSGAAVGVSRTVLPAGREGPGAPVDVQPHSRQDPETLAERERHAVPPSERRWMRQRPFRIPPFGVPIRRPTPEPARRADGGPVAGPSPKSSPPPSSPGRHVHVAVLPSWARSRPGRRHPCRLPSAVTFVVPSAYGSSESRWSSRVPACPAPLPPPWFDEANRPPPRPRTPTNVHERSASERAEAGPGMTIRPPCTRVISTSRYLPRSTAVAPR